MMRVAPGASTAVLAVLLASLGGAAVAQTTGDSSGQDAGATARTGAQVYAEICQACHMANAEGGKGASAIPALAHNPKLADADWMVGTILRGRGGMPAFAEMLTPVQIAGVTTYVRTHFGNGFARPVTPDDVKRLSSGSDDSTTE